VTLAFCKLYCKLCLYYISCRHVGPVEQYTYDMPCKLFRICDALS